MILTVPRFFHKSKRIAEPEILDSLPADDPAAIRSRGDLKLVNFLMGNQRWIVRQLAGQHHGTPPAQGWELGAGDSTLGAAIAQRLGTDSLEITGLDFAPRSRDWPASWKWDQRDILTVAEESPPAELVIANLILHHFQDPELEQLGSWINARANTVIAVEPLRANFPHALAFAMRAFGINYVTREDIHTSIRAGFHGEELPDLLGLDQDNWDVKVSTNLLGAYQMIATRRS